MKRVLIVNTVNTGYTGITSVMMNYVRRTCDRIQYDFVLCGFVEEAFAEDIGRLGIPILKPPCSRVKNPVRYYFWLRAILKAKHYDVIHVHGNSGTMYIEIRAAQSAKIPVRIAHSHSTSCKFQLAHKLLKPLLNRSVTHAVACSEKAGQWLFDRAYTVLHNGIDVERYRFSPEVREEYRRRLQLEDAFVIGHIGYMAYEKNHAFLLTVFEKYLLQDPAAHLLLIGDGKLRGEVEQTIAQKGLQKHVSLLGKRGDVAQLYQCMDVFVLPSHWEGLPVTLAEAQSAGLQCVVSDTVTSEVNITGNVRYLGIGTRDVDAWVRALLKIKQENKTRLGWSDSIAKSELNIDNGVNDLLEIYGCKKQER